MGQEQTLMIVAGEASGDAHAASLVEELRRIAPGIQFFGCTGPKMNSAGVEATVNADSLSITGVGAVARAIPMFLGVMSRLVEAARRRKPDLVILVDFPEFNLRLARRLKRNGHRILYYISPQMWAWREYRVRTIRRYVDHVVSILPFEKDWYRARGFDNVTYVGHPLVGNVTTRTSKTDFCLRHSLDPAAPIISLLPGSRRKEIRLILPEMLAASSLLQGSNSSIQFVIALAPDRSEDEVAEAISAVERVGHKIPKRLHTLRGEMYDALAASDAAAVTSGTATLEAALIGTPMVVVYKMSWMDGVLLRPLINTDKVGLVNLLADSHVATELIQDDLTPEQLAAELQRLLDPVINALTRDRLAPVATSLGKPGASRRSAAAILELMGLDR